MNPASTMTHGTRQRQVSNSLDENGFIANPEQTYGIVYRVTNRINGKTYIGQTVHDLTIRWRDGHLSSSRTNRSNMVIAKAINKYGVDAFEVVEIDRADSRAELDYLERYWIRFHDSMNAKHGYNLKEGGANGRMRQDVIDRIAATKRGVPLPPHHPFHIKGVRRGIAGEFKKGQPAYNKGIALTTEQRKQISVTLKHKYATGEVTGTKGKKFVHCQRPVQCIETGHVFTGAVMAAISLLPPGYTKREQDIGSAKISGAAIHGHRAFGLHWRRLENGRRFKPNPITH